MSIRKVGGVWADADEALAIETKSLNDVISIVEKYGSCRERLSSSLPDRKELIDSLEALYTKIASLEKVIKDKASDDDGEYWEEMER